MNDADEGSAGKKPKPARSSVGFPYSDLDASIDVARGIYNAGGNFCDTAQLAAQLKMEASGGGFRLRVNSAQTFGLIVSERGGRVSLTPLGKQILDSASERKCRVEAFLNVELYSAVYDEFKGSSLPPPSALEQAMIGMGVGKNVADRARQVLVRSAKQAGFFDQASDRLVKPNLGNGSAGGAAPQAVREEQAPTAKNPDQHPLISGLLLTLPSPGEPWGIRDRLNWLTMANSIFRAIYLPGDDDTGEVTVTIKNIGIE